ncbi:DUF1772 domain-containing protein [Polaromonas sp.]|uniref:anthrone oxygenase family protein n=1 Tax=Polaromonas sp. TaxID=1869339 RepID=UPI003CA25392
MRYQITLAVEVLATCLLGIMAGFFFAFAVDVAPAMANLDASGYITTQQWINRVVRNATFGGIYFGSVLLPFAAAAVVFWCGRRKAGVVWLLIAFTYFVAVFWVTRTVNVPINNELASWQPALPPGNWQAARDTWNQSNFARTVASLACFVASVVLVTVSRQPPPKA